MKFSAIILLFIASPVLAQNKAEMIAKIREQFQAINKESNYQKLSLENEEFLPQPTDGGGELIGYYKNASLKKIVVRVGISHGKQLFEFYFQNDRLIFVFEKFEQFVYDEKKEAFDYENPETTFEGRYYFNNNKLIEQVTTGHNRFEDETLDPEKILMQEANDYKRLLNKKSAKKSKDLINNTA